MGLAAARRPVQEDAAADLLAVRGEDLRVSERVDDLHADLVLHAVHPADVLEVHGRLLQQQILVEGGAVFVPVRPDTAVDHFRGFRFGLDAEAGGEVVSGECGIEGECPAEGGHRVGDLVLVEEQPRVQHVGPGRGIRIGKDVLENHQRDLRLPGRHVGVDEPEPGIEVIGRAVQGFPVLGDGLGCQAFLQQGCGQVEAKREIVGGNRKRFTQRFHGIGFGHGDLAGVRTGRPGKDR